MKFPPPLRLTIPCLLLAAGLLALVVSYQLNVRDDLRRNEALAMDRLRANGNRLAGLIEYFLARGDADGANAEMGLTAPLPHLKMACVCDATNRILFCTASRWRGEPLKASPFGVVVPLVETMRQTSRTQIDTLPEQTAVGVFPVRMPPQPGQLATTGTGAVLMEFDLSDAARQARAEAAHEAQVLGGVLGGAALGVWGVMHAIFTRRVTRLVRATRQLATGRLDFKAGLQGSDELREISDELDQTAAQLARRESALRESEQRFRELADQAPMMIWVMEPDGSASFLSKSWYEFTGRAPETALGFGWVEAVHPSHRDPADKIFSAARASQRGFEQEYELLRKDGQYRWVIDIGMPRFGKRNEFLGFVGSILDITDRKETETALIESEHQLAVFVEHAPAAIAMFDMTMRYLAASRRWGTDFGVDAKGIIGRSHYEVFPDIPERWKDVHRRCLSGVTERRDEELFERADGRQQWLRWEICPWWTATGEVGGIVIFTEDITSRKQAERALRESEERFRQMAAHIGDVFWIASADMSRILYVSPAYEEIWGRSCESLHANPRQWREAIVPEDLPGVEKAFSALHQGATEASAEYRICRPDGLIRHVYDRSYAIRDAAGLLLGLTGAATDITERKLAERALRDSEERFRTIVETEPECVKLLSRDGTVLDMNPAGLRMLEVDSVDEILGCKALDCVAPQHRAAFQGLCVRVFAGDRQELEFELIGRKGTRRWMITTAVPLHDAEGRVSSLLAVTRDITARKRAEDALRESEARLRAVVETAVEGIITIDERGLIESFNPAAEKIFGYVQEEVLGRNIKVLMPMPFQRAHDDYLANYLRTGEKKIIGSGREVLGLRKHGTVFPMELSVAEIWLEGRRKFTGFVRDVTRRKETEQQINRYAKELSAKNKELETILFIISHDLRSPLVNVQGFARRLGRSCERLAKIVAETPGEAVPRVELGPALEREIPQSLGFIQAGAARMDALLSGFLRFSRLGRVAVSPQPLDMQALLEEAVQSIRFQLDQLQAEVKIEALPRCLGDSTLVNQVFLNLIDNAVKYRHPARTPLVKVEGRLDGLEVVYAVIDNGLGISPEHHAKVFEIFHRLNPDASPGEGLGLAIAQRILERQQGRIWLESILGEGTTFFVALPAGPESAYKG